MHGFAYGTDAAIFFAIKEVILFYLTAPIYTVFLFVFKESMFFFRCVESYSTSFPFLGSFFRFLLPNITFILTVIIVMSLISGYERKRTFVLGWPIFLCFHCFLFFSNHLSDTLISHLFVSCLLSSLWLWICISGKSFITANIY